jgi:hypothetical protein
MTSLADLITEKTEIDKKLATLTSHYEDGSNAYIIALRRYTERRHILCRQIETLEWQARADAARVS